MKAGHWLAALLAVAAVCWWALGHPGYETWEQRSERLDQEAKATQEARPKLYRWRDAHGTLQITDKPPRGRKYTVVDLDKQANVNVIPMSEAIHPKDPDAAPADDKAK